MDHIAGMEVLCGTEQLVQNVLLVHFLEDVALFDDVVKVRICDQDQDPIAKSSNLIVSIAYCMKHNDACADAPTKSLY